MDILGWDCPAPTDDDAEYALPGDNGQYDLWDLNCCVVWDAYRQGDTILRNRVLAHWDAMLTKQRLF